MKALWGNGNGHHQAENGAVVATEALPAPEPMPQPPHYCQAHWAEFKRHEKGSQVWYSHRLAEGGYCREK
jgi:hypothetical protein